MKPAHWDPSGPPPEFIRKRRVGRMVIVDMLPKDWRELVHEYGLNIVMALRDSGVTRVRSGRHIIETVLNELSPTRGASSSQGTKADRGLVLIPREPTEGMIEASMATITGGGAAISKHQKHRLRLRAAIAAATGAKHTIVK